MAHSPCMKNRSLKANWWSLKAGFTVTNENCQEFCEYQIKFHSTQERGSAIGTLQIRIRVGEPYSYTLTFGSRAAYILTKRKRIRIRRWPGES